MKAASDGAALVVAIGGFSQFVPVPRVAKVAVNVPLEPMVQVADEVTE